jgi:hypothetical protein
MTSVREEICLVIVSFVPLHNKGKRAFESEVRGGGYGWFGIVRCLGASQYVDTANRRSSKSMILSGFGHDGLGLG